MRRAFFVPIVQERLWEHEAAANAAWSLFIARLYTLIGAPRNATRIAADQTRRALRAIPTLFAQTGAYVTVATEGDALLGSS